MNPIENPPDTPARERLQSVRLRATTPRVQVMKALLRRPRDWFSAETLYRDLLSHGFDVSLGTLYRSVSDLAGRGLLLRLVDENGKRFFRLREDDATLHRIVCRVTGRLLALTDDISPAHLACVLRGKGLMLAEATLTVQVSCVADVAAMAEAADMQYADDADQPETTPPAAPVVGATASASQESRWRV